MCVYIKYSFYPQNNTKDRKTYIAYEIKNV